MATLLTTIARRCIDEYEGVTMRQFYSLDAQNVHGYCSDRLLGVLLEEALVRKPATMGQCISEAVQDRDLELAFEYLEYLLPNNLRYNAKFRQTHDFMVVLAHEVKAELFAELDSVRVHGARS